MTQATTTRRRTLADAVDDAAFYAYEHQLHLASSLGIGASWRLVPEQGCAHFVGHRELVCPVQIIGVTKGTSWEWGWASPNVTAPRSVAANTVREFGTSHDMPVFTEPRLQLESGDPERLVTGAKIIHRRWTTFAFPVDGMVMHGALHHRDLSLPEPSATTVVQALSQGRDALALSNTRRAVRSYARLRGLARQDRRDRSATRLVLPNGDAVLVTYRPDGSMASAVPA